MLLLQTKERYEKSLEELDKLTPQYMENMEQVFEQWQQFEDKRIRFFKDLLLEVKQHLDLSTNHKSALRAAALNFFFCPPSTPKKPNMLLNRFQTIYHTLEDTIGATDAEEDLKWFRSNHGPGMPMNWPQFEVTRRCSILIFGRGGSKDLDGPGIFAGSARWRMQIQVQKVPKPHQSLALATGASKPWQGVDFLHLDLPPLLFT